MSLRTYVFIVGGLLAVVGFFALLMPVTIMSNEILNLRADCGSGFAILDDEGPFTQTAGWRVQCEDAVAGRRAWAYPLLFGGLVVAAGGFVVRDKRDEQSPTDAVS